VVAGAMTEGVVRSTGIAADTAMAGRSNRDARN